MRLRSSMVRIGGIGGVETLYEHRMKGYARRLLAEAVGIMREREYDMSILFGIPNFYHRFGFVSTLCEYKMELPVRFVEKAPSFYRVEPYSLEYKEEVLKLYHKDNATRNGSIVRNPSIWDGFTLGSSWGTQVNAVVMLLENKFMGYAVYDKSEERVNVTELASYDKNGSSTLLNYFASKAIEYRVENINVFIPPDHPFVNFCRNYGFNFSMFFPNNRAGMGRIINLETTFRKLLSYLDSKVNEIGIKDKIIISFSTEIGVVNLKIESAGASIAERDIIPDYTLNLSQTQLTKLIMGYASIGDILYEAKVELPAEIVSIIDKLFPIGYQYMYLGDRF
jgi:predicted acetyltransferase